MSRPAGPHPVPGRHEAEATDRDDDTATTVEVTSVSGSRVLLDDAAFEPVREAGEFLIRRTVIEKVG